MNLEKILYTTIIMRLEEILDVSMTNLDYVHSHLPFYETLLVSKKESAKNILEIGISRGGSIKLWSDYFINATVIGLDIMDINNFPEEIKNKENIVLHTSIDAYNNDFFNNYFLNNTTKYDFIVDDGDHKLASMLQFIKLYSQIMTDDGILIIEEIKNPNWIDTLKNEVPSHLKKFIKTYDLRSIRDPNDNLVFIIDKSDINH